MGIDYNEVAAYLESLHERLGEYKSRRRADLAMAALFAVVILFFLMLFLNGQIPRAADGLIVFLLVSGAAWIGLRMFQTQTEARELEKEVELLRYRLVADDVSLEKLKNDEKPKRESASGADLDTLAELGQLQVGDDGELVITPASDPKRLSKD
jgi:hypothetical protein